ncbi:MAG TPA: terminase family protein [Gemmatimonadales bacterium]|nr:terminase family protein [Gemmatimonadales bacterium]
MEEILLRGMTEPEDPKDPNGPRRPVEIDPWQRELLRAYGRYERRLSVRSGHGVGKTACLAWITIHHLITEYPQKTAITAPTSKQLFNVLWPEIGKWLSKCPDYVRAMFEVTSERIVQKSAPSESFISATVSRPESPEALAGVHCDDGSVLLIADEASGIHEIIYESASGSMSGQNATTILAGNPVRTAGLFFDTHHKLKDLWFTLVVNGETCRRVAPDFVEDMKRRYGPESNGYRVRVQGEFPRADNDTIIPYELVASSQMRDITPNPQAPVIWGLDVARYGGDRSALVKRRGTVVAKPVAWRDKDLMQLSALVKAEFDGTAVQDRPVDILIDSIGLGAGVVDRLRQLGLPARGINVSEAAALTDHYVNLRAELWFKAKEFFTRQDCQLPPDVPDDSAGSLGAELALLRYKFSRTAKFQVESKDEVKRRGYASPDLADALVLTFASTAATTLHGSAGSAAWNTPLRRGIKGIV